MPEPLFRDAKLKIKRANEHIQELQRKLSVFLQTDFYRFYVKEDADTGMNHVIFESTAAMPEDIALILGDAMHNLRAALDYVAFEVVDKAGGSTDYVKFPVRETRDELVAALKGGEIKVAGADIIALITDVIQPYKGGNGTALCVLNSLDIGDKHYRLTPIISLTALTNVSGRAPGIRFHNETLIVSHGRELNYLLTPGKIILDGNPKPAFTVLFDKGQPFEGRAVVPTLHQLSQLISGILEAIEQAYLARQQGSSHTNPAESN